MNNSLKDGCTFNFKWPSPLVCPTCRKENASRWKVNNLLKNTKSKCYDNIMTVTFSENDDCIINNRKTKPNNEDHKTFNSDFNIINSQTLQQNRAISNLVVRKKRKLSINLINKQQNDNLDLGYVDTIYEFLPCKFYDNLNSDLIYIVIFIPVVFFITCVIILIIYCKYRAVRNDYQRLQEENDVQPNIPKIET